MDPHALLSTGQAAKRLGVGKTTHDNLPAGYVAGKAVRHG